MAELPITNCHAGVSIEFPDGKIHAEVFCGSYDNSSGARGKLVRFERHAFIHPVGESVESVQCGLCHGKSCTHYSGDSYLNVSDR